MGLSPKISVKLGLMLTSNELHSPFVLNYFTASAEGTDMCDCLGQ